MQPRSTRFMQPCRSKCARSAQVSRPRVSEPARTAGGELAQPCLARELTQMRRRMTPNHPTLRDLRSFVSIRGAKLPAAREPTNHVLDHFLPRSCPKITCKFFTRKYKSARENTVFSKRGCATSLGILGQTEHVRILFNNYFAREFASVLRASSWRNCQKLSQNSPLPQNWRVGQNRLRFAQSRFASFQLFAAYCLPHTAYSNQETIWPLKRPPPSTTITTKSPRSNMRWRTRKAA
jgi:hypothetical protein